MIIEYFIQCSCGSNMTVRVDGDCKFLNIYCNKCKNVAVEHMKDAENLLIAKLMINPIIWKIRQTKRIIFLKMKKLPIQKRLFKLKL